MKKWIALLTVLLLFVAPFYASGEESEGELRHEVTEDVSEFVVDEEAGLSQGIGENEVSIGTDVYLWVDPDTSSYVTFQVVDDNGHPLKNAQIYLTYNGITELCGISDENGECSIYLFRDVEYEYTVVLDGFRTGTGKFTATEDVTLITVVLEEYHRLNVYVKDGDTLLPGVKVTINGKEYVTDDLGKVSSLRVRGQYYIVVYTPDGRQMNVIAIVQEDLDVVIDISQQYGTAEGGFLVYNKYYSPEDYVLTKYLHLAEDLQQHPEETDDAFAQRIARYLEENPALILVQAQPEREQLAEGTDRDILREDGTALYAQRSLMPQGSLLRAWEEDKYTQLVFTNEDVGISVELAELRSAAVTKVFALVDALVNTKEGAALIANEETLAEKKGLQEAGLAELDAADIDVTKIDFNAIRTFEFTFVHEAEDAQLPDRDTHEVLASNLYDEAIFEFRLTPIDLDYVLELLFEELQGAEQPADEIWLTSTDYYRTYLMLRQANGKLTDEEGEEIYRYLTDGYLSAEELKVLRSQARNGSLSAETVEELFHKGVRDKMYRISCWIHVEGVQVNITPLLDSMQVLWLADADYQAAYINQLQLLQASHPTVAEHQLRTQYALELDQSARMQLENEIQLLTWDNLYQEETVAHNIKVMRRLPLEGTEFASLIRSKWYDGVNVDVRAEDVAVAGETLLWYKAYAEWSQVAQKESYAFVTDWTLTGLVWLRDLSEAIN